MAVRRAVRALAAAFAAVAAAAHRLLAVLSGDSGPRWEGPAQRPGSSPARDGTRSGHRGVLGAVPDAVAGAEAGEGGGEGGGEGSGGRRWRLLRDRHALLLAPAAALAADASAWLAEAADAKHGDPPLFSAGDAAAASAAGAAPGPGRAGLGVGAGARRVVPLGFLLGNALTEPAAVAAQLAARRLWLGDHDDHDDGACAGRTGNGDGAAAGADGAAAGADGLPSTAGRYGCAGCAG
jgi:hypothetical protein